MDSEHKTIIKVEGDTSGAEAGLKRVGKAVDALPLGLGNVVKGLGWVRQGLNAVMRAFGLFGLAVQGVQALISAYNKLREFMDRAKKAAEDLREKIASEKMVTFLKLASAEYDRINKKLAEAAKLEEERNKIIESRMQKQRSVEDADRELRKQREIAALDPNANNYAESRAEIDRKYASEASNAAAERARQDSMREYDALNAKADAKDREAEALARQLERANGKADVAVERNNNAYMAARGGDPDAVRRAKEAEDQLNAAVDFAKKIREQMEAAKREAEALRRQANEKVGSDQDAQKRNQAEQLRIANEKRDAEAAAKRKEDAKADADFAEKQRKARESSDAAAEFVRAYEREQERNGNGEKDKAEKAAASFSENIGDLAAPSQNRLTAMGLGSGVSADRYVSDISVGVRDLVRISSETLGAIRNLDGASANTSATFS